MSNVELIKWLEVDERIMSQRAKIKWLKLGDDNKAYFHASVKEWKPSCRYL